MFLRILIAFCMVSTVSSVTMAMCQAYCASVQGGASHPNCAPWISFANQNNKTCFNLCAARCYTTYDGSCMTNTNFRCCLKRTPVPNNEFQQSGCNVLYNNLPGAQDD